MANEIFVGTPVTNRGVENTSKSFLTLVNTDNFKDLGQFILFDWFECTILSESYDFSFDSGEFFGISSFYNKTIDLFNYLFNISSDNLVFEYKGINGYNSCFSYNNIYIYWHSSRSDMGFHIKMSGQGCRDFEKLGLDYIDFFKKLNKFDLNYNRIDISIDDFTGNYFTISKLLHYIRNGSVSSKFRSSINIEKLDLSNSNNIGHTLQFGSRASNIQVTFYNKLLERQSQNIIVDNYVKFWVRTETRFRSECARNIVKLIVENPEKLNIIVKSILADYIDFKTLDSKSDTNLSRRPTASFWLRFLGNIEHLKLTNYLPEDSITRKQSWLYESTSKSALMVALSKLDNLSLDDDSCSDFMLELLKNGKERLHYKDVQIINQYRVLHKLEPFSYSQILDYIDDINEVSFNTISKDSCKAT